MARLLLCLPVPAHLLFLMVIKLTRDSFMFTGSFLFVYSLTAWLQVALLLCLAYGLTHFLWKRGVNPDNWAIPFMTAFADLIGSAMLAVAFIVLFELKDENALHPASMDRSSLTVGQLLLSSGTTSAPFHRFNLHNSTTSAISRSLSETLVALNVTPTLPLSSLTNMWLDSSRSLLLASSPSLPLNVTFTSF